MERSNCASPIAAASCALDRGFRKVGAQALDHLSQAEALVQRTSGAIGRTCSATPDFRRFC
jgi:hypothetical protein